MNNLDLYDKFREAPPEALKSIPAGRLRGMSDINPIWRIKVLTEQFGPCGVGWKYTIDRRWMESSPTGEIAAFVEISLFIKHEGEWSEAIPGTGGSSFVANEKNGLYMSDECFKMALTDAISVSCKALGIAANVYWGSDKTKYSSPDKIKQTTVCPQCGNTVKNVKLGEKRIPGETFVKETGMCSDCYQAKKKHAAQPTEINTEAS